MPVAASDVAFAGIPDVLDNLTLNILDMLDILFLDNLDIFDQWSDIHLGDRLLL